jgi:hypothetical protein
MASARRVIPKFLQGSRTVADIEGAEGPLTTEHLHRNRLAEAFIRGIEAGAEEPSLAGDGDAMYEAFRRWADA